MGRISYDDSLIFAKKQKNKKTKIQKDKNTKIQKDKNTKYKTQNANTEYRLQKKCQKSPILRKFDFSNF